MYSLENIVNDILVTLVTARETYPGDHSVMNEHIKSLWCTLETKRILYVSSTLIKAKTEPPELALLRRHQWWLLLGKKVLQKPGHRGKRLLLSRAQRSAVEVRREPGLIALVIQSRNSSCPHEGGWMVPILAAEHCPCFPPRDICSPVVIKVPWKGRGY